MLQCDLKRVLSLACLPPLCTLFTFSFFAGGASLSLIYDTLEFLSLQSILNNYYYSQTKTIEKKKNVLFPC